MIYLFDSIVIKKCSNNSYLITKYKKKYFFKFMLEDVFRFVEHQQKATWGLGYKLPLTRNRVDVVSNEVEAIADARVKFDSFHWYSRHYTPSISHQGMLCKQILSKIPTQLRCTEWSVLMKEKDNQNLWSFKLGSHLNMNVPIWINVGFQQRNRQDSQNLNDHTFGRLPVTSAQ